MKTTTWRARMLAIGAAAAALLCAAPAANAGLLVESAGSCEHANLENPFTPWLDPMNYELVPGGDFEGATDGWKLNGASVKAGNERFYVAGADDSRSLTLPPGASATTPVMCAGLAEPTLRFFAKGRSSSLLGGALSSVRVDVLFEDKLGVLKSLPIGAAALSPEWNPSLPLPVTVNLLALLPNDSTPVSFRFTAQGSATWQIDDVYLDPSRRS